MKPKILFIHGWNDNWKSYLDFCKYSNSKGYEISFCESLGRHRKDIKTSSGIVWKHIIKEDLRNIVIVAFSKGGIVGKNIMVNFDTEKRILGMVSVASPFSGTIFADMAPFFRVSELGTRSKIIKSLNKNIELNKKIISIYPSKDFVVWHKNGSRLIGALDNIEVPTVGHLKVFRDQNTYAAVLSSLDKFF